MNSLPLDLALGFVIGLSLGLLGGGGSILTVPALVYLVGQTPQVAITTSLAIVGATSALAALFHRAQGTLNWRVALLFGGAGMAASFLAAGLSKRFSPALLLVAFALLMLIIGGLMLAPPALRRVSKAKPGDACQAGQIHTNGLRHASFLTPTLFTFPDIKF
ncbi:MAG: sulfite exporter TauE/SafE family protein, partial [Anaerolineae bacterium]